MHLFLIVYWLRFQFFWVYSIINFKSKRLRRRILLEIKFGSHFLIDRYFPLMNQGPFCRTWEGLSGFMNLTIKKSRPRSISEKDFVTFQRVISLFIGIKRVIVFPKSLIMGDCFQGNWSLSFSSLERKKVFMSLATSSILSKDCYR